MQDYFNYNVASVGSAFNDTRKVKVLSLPETIKEKSTFRAKALRRELVVKDDEGPSLESSNFPLSFQVVREPLPFADYFNTFFCFEIIYLQSAQKFSIVQANAVLSRDICNVKAVVLNVNAIQSSRITSEQDNSPSHSYNYTLLVKIS